jgi:hypothetical protein
MYDPGINEGDIGTVIELVVHDSDDAVVDISGASTKQIKITNPSGTTSTKDGSFSTDGTDGKLRYTTVSGDLNQEGLWKARAYLVFAGGWAGHSSIASFLVHAV